MGKKYKCVAGGHIVDEDDIKNGRCPIDGTTEFIPLVSERVELVKDGTSSYISFHKNTMVGRDSCRVFTDDYKFVSSEQFKLTKKEEFWEIEGKSDVVNSTILNGEPIDGESRKLSDGDEILIGDTNTGNGLKLRVRMKK